MQLRRLAVILLIAGGSGLAAFGMATLPIVGRLMEQVELTTLDWRVRSVAAPPRDASQVVLVLFDSTSVREWPYEVPFPRMVLAELVEQISGAGARAIGLDVFLARRYPELDVLGKGDERLRDAIAAAGNVILVGPSEELPGTLRERAFLEPDPYFAEVAAGLATADLPTPYETVRDVVLTVRTPEGLVPGLALSLYALGEGREVEALLAEAEARGRLDVPGLPAPHARLPRSRAAQTKPILFAGPPSRTDTESGSFLAVSASMVPALATFAPGFFEDRLVLLGSGFHAEERFRSPFYDERDEGGHIHGWTYGVEVHAHALENLLSGRHPRPAGTPTTLVLILGLALIAALLTFGRGVAWGAGAGAVLVILLIGGAWQVFASTQLHLPLIAPVLAVAISLLGSTSYISVVEGRKKREIQGMFGKYVSPALVDQLVSDPSRLKLGGEKRTISILFSDLAGFTSLSESMDPERLVAVLNEYLEEMAGIVQEEQGTLDKYIGDAVMAFYGAPVALQDHAVRACRSALRMQRRLGELNAAWQGSGLPLLHMRIGVNTGTPVVGNIGGQKRFDYTALGDAVNLAARLEPACKSYGVGTMISGNTREAAGDAIVARDLDLLAVYGKAEPVAVYELVALAGEDTGARADLFRHYQQGIEAYRRRDFELALPYFEAALEEDPDDGPSLLYVERTREYIVAPPPADWDLVERRQIK
jgi:adenylate cyclase